MRHLTAVAGVVGLLLAVGAGCGSNQAKVDQETSNLKPLSVLYGQFIGQHRGQPPKDEAEFKAFVKALDPSVLKALNVADAESLFISSRDKQPYGIVYGAASGPPGPAGQPVVIYEQIGVGGRRYVASTLGAIEEVDEAKFKTLVPTAGSSAGSTAPQ